MLRLSYCALITRSQYVLAIYALISPASTSCARFSRALDSVGNRQPTSLDLIILCFYSPRPTHVLMIWTSNSCVPVVQHGLYSRLFAKGCPNGTVRDGMGPNRTKCDQTLPNGTIPDHIRKILSVGRHVGFVLEYPLTFQGTKMYLFSKLVQAKVSLYLIAT